MRYIHIWGCPAHVLKGKADKLESRQKYVCLLDVQKGQAAIHFIVRKK